MSTELMTVGQGFQAIAKTKGQNYVITNEFNGKSVVINRGSDFGLIPNTKKPSLYKSGAEKIVLSYGLMARYEIESKVENFDSKNALCYYVVRCDLVKGFFQNDGTYKEVVYTSAYGSANTNERRNGMNSVYDSANSTLKMAMKRALTSACIAVAGLSDLFTMDIEDEVSMKKADNIIKEDPEKPITSPQIKRLFAICGDIGLTQAEAKQLLATMGYTSTKSILQKDYEDVIEKIKEKKNA